MATNTSEGPAGHTSDGYIKVVNWDEYQHYKDRNPPWIKLYNSLLDDIEFMRLPVESRWLLVGLFLLASRHGNAIPLDLDAIKWRLRLPEKPDLDPLKESGHIRVLHGDSIDIADVKQNGVPEESRGEESKGESDSHAGSHTREENKADSLLPWEED